MSTHIHSHQFELPKAEATALLGVYDIMKAILRHAQAAPELAGGTPIINLMSDGNDWCVSLSVHTGTSTGGVQIIARERTLPELHRALFEHRLTRTANANPSKN